MMNLSVWASSSIRRGVAAALAAVALSQVPLCAAEHYLLPGKLDVVALLPAPPAPDSAEQNADLATTIEAHKHATKEELARADAEEKKMTFVNFAGSVGTSLDPEALPKTAALFARAQKEAEQVVDVGKEHWQRARPYTVDPIALPHADKKPSFSYPSGHSTRGTVMALLLAELYPERRDAILAQGRQIGWDRVALGRHYETDIFAGRVLGQAIVRQLHANPEFEHDFGEVKKEIQATRK
jgi:acid phosphatase (class A)